MKTYIWKKQSGSFISFEEEIDATYWEGQIGTTYQDYLDGKWVLLSSEQVAFHEEHPKASVLEVWNMELRTRTLEDAKREKNIQIAAYDRSSNVNDFTINNSIHAWITAEERANYRNSIDAAKLLGVENVSLFIGDMPITLTTQQAEIMLAQIQLYADACFIVTKNHLLNVEVLESIDVVDSYDYTTNYPTKLNFNVQ